MIKININVKKINKEYLVHAGQGIFLDVALMDRPDEYGNDGYLAQSVPKDIREKDPQLRGPIIGNWRNWEPKKKPEAPKFPKPPAREADDEIPF